jgi:hypothetical protein
MGTQKARQFCEEDVEWVLAERQTPNHLVHLLLSLVTAGLWLPIWIVITLVSSSAYRCPKCGSKTLGYAPKKYKKAIEQKKLEKLS